MTWGCALEGSGGSKHRRDDVSQRLEAGRPRLVVDLPTTSSTPRPAETASPPRSGAKYAGTARAGRGPAHGARFRRAWVTVREDIPQRTDIATPFNYRKRRHGLVGQQEGRCGGCRHEFPFRNFTVDHVIPPSRGGTDHLDNLQLLCGACNNVKGDRTQEYLLARLSERAA